MSISSIWNTVYPILIAILFFELIIIIHEGGHYFAARLMKIKVNEFSIGMGPKVFQFTKGETKYTLRWILFGGYCAMEGEDSDSDDKNAFINKKVWQRIFVVVAGAVMNLILGLVIVLIITSSQGLVGTTQIAKFEDTAVSAQSGLQVGDTIKSIDGMRVYTTNDVQTGLSRSADSTVDVVVNRNGEDINLQIEFEMDEYEGIQYIKMDFWLRGVEKTFGNVITQTFKESVSYARMVFLSVHDLLVGRYGLSDLSGPVGAVSVVSSAVKTSVYSMLKIMALLTINVGLFNLFPIPALDGWRLFVLIAEGITRKKLPSKAEYIINAVGLVLLLGVMCLVTFSDITRLF
ncbi:MAG: M50 family metallopeptidase [Eubacterium sp.]|nr:M50 family metallopeptidase [Eubacterium sp.]MDE6155451.1 M50 family metallopeptidase [Eubacterium sp.]